MYGCRGGDGCRSYSVGVMVGLQPCSKIAAQRPIGVGVMGVGV